MMNDSFFLLFPFNSILQNLITLLLVYLLAFVISYVLIKKPKITFILAPFIALYLGLLDIISDEIGVYTILIFSIFLYTEFKDKNEGVDIANI